MCIILYKLPRRDPFKRLVTELSHINNRAYNTLHSRKLQDHQELGIGSY